MCASIALSARPSMSAFTIAAWSLIERSAGPGISRRVSFGDEDQTVRIRTEERRRAVS